MRYYWNLQYQLFSVQIFYTHFVGKRQSKKKDPQTYDLCPMTSVTNYNVLYQKL
jgi:hypothetical protein